MASSAVGCRLHATGGMQHVTRQALVARAFRDRSAITVPVSYYQLLQVPSGAGTSSIREAFERLVAAPTQAAYSPDTLFSRAVILKAGTELLCDHNSRRGYDQQRLHEVKVPQADIPGAVVLLQEAGEYEAAIKLASSWLGHSNRDALEVADVATCLALAVCDQAGTKLAADGSTTSPTTPSQLVAGCQDLERALKLCQEYDVAPALQDHINEALQGYVARYALDLLALPLSSEHAAQRSRGLQLMCSMLEQAVPQESQAAAKHMAQVEALLQQARVHLTSVEQLHMQPRFKASPALTSRQHAATVAYDGAMAHIAQGWATARPHHITLADQLFEEAERLMASGEKSPVSLERACCAVLLGQTATAQRLLHLCTDNSAAPDPAIEAYVLAHSPTAEDLQPGLRMLANGWLQEALAGVRDLGPSSFGEPLAAAWFNKASVKLYIQASQSLRGGPMLSLLHLATCMTSMLTSRKAYQPTVVVGMAPGNDQVVQYDSAHQGHGEPVVERAGHVRLRARGSQHDMVKASHGAHGPGGRSAAAGSMRVGVSIDEADERLQVADVESELGVRDGMRARNTQMGEKQGLLDGLLSCMPTSLLRPAPSQKALEVAMSGMAASQVDLRRQLDQMEKAMWDGSSQLSQPHSSTPNFAVMLTQLVGSVVLGGVVLLGAARAAGITLPFGLAVVGDFWGGTRTAAVASVTRGWSRGKGCDAAQAREGRLGK